jgi:hypothetical protein
LVHAMASFIGRRVEYYARPWDEDFLIHDL